MIEYKLFLNPNQKLFFSSDFHYAHKNICRGITKWEDRVVRDFDTLEQMNDKIVDSINRTVGENDILFDLGDWALGGHENIHEFRNRIKCKTILKLAGNHDDSIVNGKNGEHRLFKELFNDTVILRVKWQETEPEVKIRKAKFILSHYPYASWPYMSSGGIHLHGHVHFSADLKFGPGKMLDVGCEGNNYIPYEMHEILGLMKDRPIKSLFRFDHHEN